MAIESLVLAIHYQNENCHPDGRIRIGVGAGEVAWRAEVLAAAGRLFAGRGRTASRSFTSGLRSGPTIRT